MSRAHDHVGEMVPVDVPAGDHASQLAKLGSNECHAGCGWEVLQIDITQRRTPEHDVHAAGPFPTLRVGVGRSNSNIGVAVAIYVADARNRHSSVISLGGSRDHEAARGWE